MYRTILVTKVRNKITKEEKEIYGRYDAVKLERDNFQIIGTCKRKYSMTDTEFALHGKIVYADTDSLFIEEAVTGLKA